MKNTKYLYQTDKEVLRIIELLELEGATSLIDNACGNGEISIQAAMKNLHCASPISISIPCSVFTEPAV